MKTILITLSAVLLVACGVAVDDIQSEPITMTIRNFDDASSNWSCVGTNTKTVFRAEDGRVDSWCGKWGEIGDKVSGCWVTGHTGSSSSRNGFHQVCNPKKK